MSEKIALTKDGYTVYVYPIEVDGYKADGWKKVPKTKPKAAVKAKPADDGNPADS